VYCPIATLIRLVISVANAFFHAISIGHVKRRYEQNEHFEKFIENISDLVRIPFYSLKLFSALLYGIFRPFEGRVIYNKIERKLVRQTDSTKIYDHYYTAYCFHPIGSMDSSKLDRTGKKLKDYVLKFPDD
jgi:hypothetical protein